MSHSDLEGFPPILKRLARFILENPEHLSRSEACALAGINKASVRLAIHRAKRKNKNFNEILRRIDNEKIIEFRPVVLAKLQEYIQKGSLKAVEIFLRMSGDLKPDKIEQHSTESHLAVVMLPGSMIRALESHPDNGYPGEGPGDTG